LLQLILFVCKLCDGVFGYFMVGHELLLTGDNYFPLFILALTPSYLDSV
jgi:hypothetical protein